MKNDRITPEKLRSALRYEPESGRFFWLVSPARSVRIGAEAARAVDGRGYRYLVVEGVRVYAQRAAWMIVKGVVVSGAQRNPITPIVTSLLCYPANVRRL